MRFCTLSDRSCLFAILLAAAIILGGCSYSGRMSEGGEELAQSPITDNPSGKRVVGRFIWHDLLTSDLTAAGGFYEELFGWQLEYLAFSAIIRNKGTRVGGIVELQSPDNNRRGAWIPSVSVEDMDAALDNVEQNDGIIVNGPVEMGRRGTAAMIRDSQGADLVLLRTEEGDPAEVEPEIGDWLWDEIWTVEPAAAEKFYTAVLGYDEIIPAKEDYGVFAENDRWQAGIRHLDRDIERSVWVPVVRVADPEVTAHKAEELGGKVLVAPDQAPSVGNIALIRDPLGALLLVQRWPPVSPGEGGE